MVSFCAASHASRPLGFSLPVRTAWALTLWGSLFSHQLMASGPRPGLKSVAAEGGPGVDTQKGDMERASPAIPAHFTGRF